MIDHSINLYFQINLFHNVAASMSFHFFVSPSYRILSDVVLYTLYLFFCMSWGPSDTDEQRKLGNWSKKGTRKNYRKSFSFIRCEILIKAILGKQSISHNGNNASSEMKTKKNWHQKETSWGKLRVDT